MNTFYQWQYFLAVADFLGQFVYVIGNYFHILCVTGPTCYTHKKNLYTCNTQFVNPVKLDYLPICFDLYSL
jgi:hypothetical protein